MSAPLIICTADHLLLCDVAGAPEKHLTCREGLCMGVWSERWRSEEQGGAAAHISERRPAALQGAGRTDRSGIGVHCDGDMRVLAPRMHRARLPACREANRARAPSTGTGLGGEVLHVTQRHAGRSSDYCSDHCRIGPVVIITPASDEPCQRRPPLRCVSVMRKLVVQSCIAARPDGILRPLHRICSHHVQLVWRRDVLGDTDGINARACAYTPRFP